METDIKRINFFDGLFLRQGEFLAEQLYHLHMRRRVHYMLFDGSGVVQVEPGDLRITPTNPPLDKTFRVTAGMALSHRADLREGREIILRADSAPIDLGAQGFSGAQEAFVAIHYTDVLIEPQTGIEPNTETRVEEIPVITVHNAAAPWPPAASLPNGEQYIRLGRLRFADMTVDESQRQIARLRSGLIGGVMSPGAPTITMLSPSSAAPSSTVPVQITGTNLTGAMVTSSDIINVTITGVTATATTVDFTLTLGAAASTFTITVATGTPPAASTSFTVTATPAPVIVLVSPPQQASGGQVSIRGTNLRDVLLAVGAPATGTTIRLTGSGFTKTVPTADIVVRPDIGVNQIVQFQVPDRSGTTWTAQETVTLELEFGGPPAATDSFQYDD